MCVCDREKEASALGDGEYLFHASWGKKERFTIATQAGRVDFFSLTHCVGQQIDRVFFFFALLSPRTKREKVASPRRSIFVDGTEREEFIFERVFFLFFFKSKFCVIAVWMSCAFVAILACLIACRCLCFACHADCCCSCCRQSCCCCCSCQAAAAATNCLLEGPRRIRCSMHHVKGRSYSK